MSITAVMARVWSILVMTVPRFDSCLLLLLAVLLIGCGGNDASLRTAEADLESETANDPMEEAERLRRIGDLDGAAQTLNRAMIEDPGNANAILLAARVEADRGNAEVAAELAGSIDPQSRLRRAAITLHAEQLVKLSRYSMAADVYIVGLEQSENPQWRHQAWRLLNRTGRREEASDQAISLCRLGQATEDELLSLISRSRAFPTPEMLEKKGSSADASAFSAGLGKARWYFSTGEYDRAIEELADQIENGFSSAAGEALHGRLLAETQRWAEFLDWHANVSDMAKSYANYWAAIGAFYIDNREYEAAARALLEAIGRDPTDRIGVQRLSRALSSIGRADDAEQFRYRGIEIAHTEREATDLFARPSDLEVRKKLTRYILELGRPFETLSWSLTMMPIRAVGPRQSVARQREALLRDKDALAMANESSWLGLRPDQFQWKTAKSELLAGKGRATGQSPRSLRAMKATPRLINRADEAGLAFQWYKDVDIDLATIPIHESLGGGIAVLDYDLDGWPDVYLGQGAGEPPTDRCVRSSQLFRNVDASFQSMTTSSGTSDNNYSSGISAGDVNQDGFPDLFMGSLGHNRLLINNGDGTFRDGTMQLGEFADRFTASVGIGDINGDGLPDLFETNYIEMDGAFELPQPGPDGRLIQPTPLSHYADKDRWFQNLGDGRFQIHEIERSTAKPGTSLGLVITDFNSDGKNEVFVGNDVRPNHFLVQSDNNQFVNFADANGLANGFDGVANGCMGIATGDFNRDGTLDLQIANYSKESANLYLQTKVGEFTDYSARFGLSKATHAYVGFGTKAVDLDRNGLLDFIVSNGHIFDMRHEGEPYEMSPQVMMSDGQGYEVTDVDDSSGYWDETYLGRTIAMIDFDRDGAVDFLIGHLDKPLALLRNETDAEEKNWVQFELIGTASERDAIGAKVTLRVGRESLTQWVTAGDGYFCNDEAVLTVAFSSDETISGVEVTWPSGASQSYPSPDPGERYLVIEGTTELESR